MEFTARYELPTVAYTVNGNATELNANQTALVGGTPGFHFTNPNHNDWAPRLGFAYRINDKTVFRGGGGIYYNPNQTNSYTFLSNNPPFATILNCTWSSGLTPVKFERSVSPRRVCVLLVLPLSVGTIATPPWYQPTGRMNQWSAGLGAASCGRGVTSKSIISVRIVITLTAATTTTRRSRGRVR